MVLGYKENYYLLYGHHTVIYCDNKPSVDRATKTEKNFITLLGDLVNCTRSKVEYRPGKDMGGPDFLSRYKAPEIRVITNNIRRDMPYLEEILKRQEEDEEVFAIKKAITGGEEEIPGENFQHLKDNLFVSKGIFSSKMMETT